jgi:hypothetical protein
VKLIFRGDTDPTRHSDQFVHGGYVLERDGPPVEVDPATAMDLLNMAHVQFEVVEENPQVEDDAQVVPPALSSMGIVVGPTEISTYEGPVGDSPSGDAGSQKARKGKARRKASR